MSHRQYKEDKITGSHSSDQQQYGHWERRIMTLLLDQPNAGETNHSREIEQTIRREIRIPEEEESQVGDGPNTANIRQGPELRIDRAHNLERSFNSGDA